MDLKLPALNVAESVLSDTLGSYMMPEVIDESSLASIDPQDMTEVEESVTFRIVGNSTIHGCATLVDSRGYSYTVHKKGK
jgi:hypothetical protein